MLLEQSNRLVAVTGLRHHFHVGLLIDHSRESVAYHRMVIREDHPNLFLVATATITPLRARFGQPYAHPRSRTRLALRSPLPADRARRADACS